MKYEISILRSSPDFLSKTFLREKLDDLQLKVAFPNTMQGWLARGLVERGERRDTGRE